TVRRVRSHASFLLCWVRTLFSAGATARDHLRGGAELFESTSRIGSGSFRWRVDRPASSVDLRLEETQQRQSFEFDTASTTGRIALHSPAGAGTDSGAEECREQDWRQPPCGTQRSSGRYHSQVVMLGAWAVWRCRFPLCRRVRRSRYLLLPIYTKKSAIPEVC